jgi:hypothetical protein
LVRMTLPVVDSLLLLYLTLNVLGSLYAYKPGSISLMKLVSQCLVYILTIVSSYRWNVPEINMK